MENIETIPIRKNGQSLYLRIPAKFVRAHKLIPGDLMVLDFSKLKIIRQSDAVE